MTSFWEGGYEKRILGRTGSRTSPPRKEEPTGFCESCFQVFHGRSAPFTNRVGTHMMKNDKAYSACYGERVEAAVKKLRS